MTRAGKITRIVLANEAETDDVAALKAQRYAAIERLAQMLGIEDSRGVFSEVIRQFCDVARYCPHEAAAMIQECQRRQALAEKLQ